MTVSTPQWQPSARIDTLRRRAAVLEDVREFFAARGVMEVETPAVISHAVSDPQLANVHCDLAVRPGVPFFLHTSPEYHMKRLLAAGAPDIFQICKVFRDGELGDRHLPEFTLIEWYRQRMAFTDIVNETCALVVRAEQCLGRTPGTPRRLSYRDVFVEFAGLDPLTAGLDELRDRVGSGNPDGDKDLRRSLGANRTSWLDLIMVELIEPRLAPLGLVVIEKYPAEQAALARLDPADHRVAERFEVYLNGIELANGYGELTHGGEQRQRFEADRGQRRERGLPDAAPDAFFLAALDAGLPDCCGVALGFDRLLMACLDLAKISEVVSFPVPETP